MHMKSNDFLEHCFNAFILFLVAVAELPWVWVEEGWLLVSLVLYLHYKDTSLGLLLMTEAAFQSTVDA